LQEGRSGPPKPPERVVPEYELPARAITVEASQYQSTVWSTSWKEAPGEGEVIVAVQTPVALQVDESTTVSSAVVPTLTLLRNV
jgi:hypothetical protein